MADLLHTPAGTSGQAQGGVVDALQLALLLKRLTAEFYERGVTPSALIASVDRTVFTAIRAHEAAHAAALTALLLARDVTPAPEPAFDFTAKGAFPAFAFSGTPNQYETFKAIAQALEDLSVRALKGQVAQLMEDKPALNALLAMHSVDARHAAIIRRIRGREPWITGSSRDDLPSVLQSVYDDEDEVMQGAVDVTTLPLVASNGGVDAATQAFDEPLTAAQVLAIVTPFLATGE